jgi:hypothetical protein
MHGLTQSINGQRIPTRTKRTVATPNYVLLESKMTGSNA